MTEFSRTDLCGTADLGAGARILTTTAHLSEFLIHVAEAMKRYGKRYPYADRPDEIDRLTTELRRSASIFRDLEAIELWQEVSGMH